MFIMSHQQNVDDHVKLLGSTVGEVQTAMTNIMNALDPTKNTALQHVGANADGMMQTATTLQQAVNALCESYTGLGSAHTAGASAMTELDDALGKRAQAIV